MGVRLRRGVVLAVLLTVGPALACDGGGTSLGGGEESGEEESQDGVVEIHLTTGFTFSEAELTIEPGTTVEWINDDDIFHTITPDGHSEWTRREMSVEGETFRHTFDTEGVFPYLCEPHESQGMTATITVEAP